MKRFLYLLLLLSSVTGVLSAQDIERKSSSDARCQLPDGKLIVVRYGVDQPTTFITSDDLVTVAGGNIKPGTYTVSTIPNSETWTMVMTEHLECGVQRDSDSYRAIRIPLSISHVPSPAKSLVISFDQRATGCTMHISSDSVKASVAFNSRNTDLPVVP